MKNKVKENKNENKKNNQNSKLSSSNKLKKFLYILPSLIFNIVETLVIILIGKLLELDIREILMVLIWFAIIRMSTHSAIHYKDWRKCFIMSALQMFSLFLTMKVGVVFSLIMATFTAIVLSGKGDIRDIFMWGGNKLNLDVFNWVRFNQDNPKLKEYEDNLFLQDKKKYYIFQYRFREFKSYSEISEIMQIDQQRIADDINIMSHFIEYSIRLSKV